MNWRNGELDNNGKLKKLKIKKLKELKTKKINKQDIEKMKIHLKKNEKLNIIKKRKIEN